MCRYLLSLFLPLCLTLSGCEILGLGGRCGDADGLSIETEHDTYHVGDDAEITLTNCSGEDVYLDGFREPNYTLYKRVDDSWEKVGFGVTLDADLKRIEHGEVYDVTVPVEPLEDRVDSIPGTYRFVLFLYDGDLPEGRPHSMNTSNTFEVTE